MNTLQINVEIPDKTGYTNVELVSKISRYIKDLLGSHSVAMRVESYPKHLTKSDAELDRILQNELSFDQCTHQELTDEQYKQLAHLANPLPKGLEKWL